MLTKILPEDKSKRNISYALLLVGSVLVIIASIVGVPDNTPMILLSLLGVLIFSIGIVHHWTEIKKFQILLIGSLIGLIFFILMHNVFYGLTVRSEGLFILEDILQFLNVIFFLLSVLICPVGIIVGLSGLVYLFIKKKINRKKNVEIIKEPETSENILDEGDMGQNL